MVDRVKPLKLESTPDGSVTDMYPVESNPAQDYFACKGISFEASNDRLLDLSAGGEVQYKDAVQTSYKTLNSIFAAIIFGNNYTYSESIAETSTTSNAVWSTKISMVTASLPVGTYLVNFAYIARRSSANTEYNVRVMDGATTLISTTETYTRTQGFNLRSSFVRLSGVSGVKTINLDFKINAGGAGTVFFKEARMTLWRVL